MSDALEMYPTLTFGPCSTSVASGCASRAMFAVAFSLPNASTAGARRMAARSSSSVPPFHQTTAKHSPSSGSSSAIVLASKGARTGSCDAVLARSADFIASAE